MVVLLDVLCICIEETNLNHNDASIKSIHNIEVSFASGYKLNGTLINGSFKTDYYKDGFMQLVQMDGVVYILRMSTHSDGSFFTSKEDGTILTLLYY